MSSYDANTGESDSSSAHNLADKLRVAATSTYVNYAEGTVTLVAVFFGCCLILTLLSFLLICYAR